MEDLKQLLHQHSKYSSYGSTDSDSDDESAQQLEQATKKRGGRSRIPTRRPNPNVYNRNALLARENRRKKKAHLEAIEKELEEVRIANRELKKALKRQMRTTGRLEREKRYFQSIVANIAEIQSLIKALNVRLPLQRANGSGLEQLLSTQSRSLTDESPRSSGKSSSRSSNYEQEPLSINFERSENGSVGSTELFNLPDHPISSCGFFEPFSSDFEPLSAFTDPWSDLLEDEFGLEDCPSLQTPKLNNIAEEHSYVDMHQGSTKEFGNAGVCLHVAHGKVSLEFCPTCYWSACRTPPPELLHDSVN